MKDFAPLDEFDEESDLDVDLEYAEDEPLEIEGAEDAVTAFPAADEVSQQAPIPLSAPLTRIATIPITDKLLAYIQAHPFSRVCRRCAASLSAPLAALR
ncbi:MAG: hypothetical protein IPK16_08395 [Anaerolineales bacterium]|nr:hypothetical protein [Anaerolineales bacterium]